MKKYAFSLLLLLTFICQGMAQDRGPYCQAYKALKEEVMDSLNRYHWNGVEIGPATYVTSTFFLYTYWLAAKASTKSINRKKNLKLFQQYAKKYLDRGLIIPSMDQNYFDLYNSKVTCRGAMNAFFNPLARPFWPINLLRTVAIFYMGLVNADVIYDLQGKFLYDHLNEQIPFREQERMMSIYSLEDNLACDIVNQENGYSQKIRDLLESDYTPFALKFLQIDALFNIGLQESTFHGI